MKVVVLEQVQKRARHDTQKQAAENAELQQRLECVSREQHELEKRNSSSEQHLLSQRRLPVQHRQMEPLARREAAAPRQAG
jgi:hypothetical protein